MFCMHCGAKLAENAAFCTNCGKPITPTTKTESHDFNSEPESPPTQAPPPDETASERDETAILRKIIGKNADYYLPQFQAINEGKAIKYNWAACLGGLFHAAYRGVWKQWFHFMKIPLASFGGSILVAIIGAGISSPTAIMIAGILAFLSSVLSFVWQAFRYPKQFNRIYFEHVTRKVRAGEERPDPSVGRIFIAMLACMALSFVLSLLTTFATVSMLGEAAEEDPSSVSVEQSSGMTASDSTEAYDSYNSDYGPPTYEDTGNTLREFLEQNNLDESNWISGTDYDAPAFTIQKTSDCGYSFTFYTNGLYQPNDAASLEIEFLEGKSYGYVTLMNSDGKLCEINLNFEEEKGIPMITLLGYSDAYLDIPDTYCYEPYAY